MFRRCFYGLNKRGPEFVAAAHDFPAAIQKSTAHVPPCWAFASETETKPAGKKALNSWIQRSSNGALIWHAATQLTLKPGRQVFFTTQTSKLTDVKLRYAKRLPDPVMKLELIFFFLSTWLLICLTTHARRVHRRDLIVFPGGGAGADDRIRTPDPPWTASSGTHSNQRFLDQNSSVCASCCLKRQNNLIYVFICQRS